MDLETLYRKEEKLLDLLVMSEGFKDEEYQNAVKRQIGRINNNIKILEEQEEFDR